MLVINYYRADLISGLEKLHRVDWVPLVEATSLAQAQALAVEWVGNDVKRAAANVYQIAHFKGEAMSLTHYLPGREPKG